MTFSFLGRPTVDFLTAPSSSSPGAMCMTMAGGASPAATLLRACDHTDVSRPAKSDGD